jgi:hypothetical protein
MPSKSSVKKEDELESDWKNLPMAGAMGTGCRSTKKVEFEWKSNMKSEFD